MRKFKESYNKEKVFKSLMAKMTIIKPLVDEKSGRTLWGTKKEEVK